MKLSKIPLIVGVFVLLLLAGQAWGATYTVNNLAEWDALSLSPDDTVNIAGDWQVDSPVIMRFSGTVNNYITINGGRISGGGNTISNLFYISGKSYIRLQNMELLNVNGNALGISSCSNIIIENVVCHPEKMDGTQAHGMYVFGTSSNVTLKNCIAFRGFYGFAVFGQNHLIENCLSFWNYSDGIRGATDNNTITYRRTLSVKNSGDGFDLFDANNKKIEDSIAAFNSKHGFKLGATQTSYGTSIMRSIGAYNEHGISANAGDGYQVTDSAALFNLQNGIDMWGAKVSLIKNSIELWNGK